MLNQNVTGGTNSETETEENFEFVEIEHENIDDFNSVDLNGRFLSLLLNVRSMNARHSQLQVYLQGLRVKPHVIVCTETWNIDCFEMFAVDGYNAYYNNSKVNLSDGVIMCIRSDLNVVENRVVRFGNVTFHSIVIKINKELTFTCTGVYRCHDIPIKIFSESVKKFL